jgi:hypothetical protein
MPAIARAPRSGFRDQRAGPERGRYGLRLVITRELSMQRSIFSQARLAQRERAL